MRDIDKLEEQIEEVMRESSEKIKRREFVVKRKVKPVEEEESLKRLKGISEGIEKVIKPKIEKVREKVEKKESLIIEARYGEGDVEQLNRGMRAVIQQAAILE